jgi:hypothetical protein
VVLQLNQRRSNAAALTGEPERPGVFLLSYKQPAAARNPFTEYPRRPSDSICLSIDFRKGEKAGDAAVLHQNAVGTQHAHV